VNVNQNLIGSIYTLRDASSTSDCGHNYIIISNNQNINKFVQAMPITSMRNKKVTIEVPIKLSNGLVSYIIPYSIQTFTSTELKVGKFRGVISDSKYITSKEFINLLMDMYLVESNIGDVDKDKVMNEYREYCNNFWKFHKNDTEYREVDNDVRSKEFDYMYKALRYWSDSELDMYINNVDSGNPNYSYNKLGFKDFREQIQFTFQVKKEREARHKLIQNMA
jgi:hypothetical protein